MLPTWRQAPNRTDHPVQRTSQILLGLVDDPTDARVTIAEILSRLRGRAFGILLILFSAPNCIPMPPGFSTLSGAAIAVVAVQLMLGRRTLRVPRWLGAKSFATADLARIVGWIAPKLARIEGWSRPRAVGLTTRGARQIIGGLILVLALVMALPIPIIGNTPPAIAIILMGFGLLERDGAVVAAGAAVGLIDIGVIVGLGFGFRELALAYMPAGWWPF